MAIIASEVRAGFEMLRPVFAGIAARHDQVLSRVVVAEQGYEGSLGGPLDEEWRNKKCIALSGLTIRNASVRQITPEEKDRVLTARPDARIEEQESGQFIHIDTAVQSQMLFSGSVDGLAQLRAPSRDAAFFLIKFLDGRHVDLKLPELVSLNPIASVKSRTGSTNLPSDLFERWVAFVHILGWQMFTNVPLRAERALWHENTRIVGDPERVQAALLGATVFAESIKHIPIPARYFASTLLSSLSVASVYAIDSLLAGEIDAPTFQTRSFRERLSRITPGRPNANKYHKLVAEILSLVFEPDLHSPRLEETLDEGRGRIDIVFDNSAERGYFADLPFRHNIKCPVVFFECKNYSDDIAGPEFAQLASRLSDKRSNVGFIVCRTIDEKNKVHKRCKDHFHEDKGHIAVLDDGDLIALLDAKVSGDSARVSRYLHDKWRPIFMNQ